MDNIAVKESRRFYFSLVFFALALSIPLLGRLALLITRHADLGGIDILELMVIGTRLDAVVAGAVTVPIALAALILPSRTWARHTLTWFGALGMALSCPV